MLPQQPESWATWPEKECIDVLYWGRSFWLYPFVSEVFIKLELLVFFLFRHQTFWMLIHVVSLTTFGFLVAVAAIVLTVHPPTLGLEYEHEQLILVFRKRHLARVRCLILVSFLQCVVVFLALYLLVAHQSFVFFKADFFPNYRLLHFLDEFRLFNGELFAQIYLFGLVAVLYRSLIMFFRRDCFLKRNSLRQSLIINRSKVVPTIRYELLRALVRWLWYLQTLTWLQTFQNSCSVLLLNWSIIQLFGWRQRLTDVRRPLHNLCFKFLLLDVLCFVFGRVEYIHRRVFHHLFIDLRLILAILLLLVIVPRYESLVLRSIGYDLLYFQGSIRAETAYRWLDSYIAALIVLLYAAPHSHRLVDIPRIGPIIASLVSTLDGTGAWVQYAVTGLHTTS